MAAPLPPQSISACMYHVCIVKRVCIITKCVVVLYIIFTATVVEQKWWCAVFGDVLVYNLVFLSVL